MPAAAAVGGAIASLFGGSTAVAGIVSAVYTGAVIGAVSGAAIAAIKGEDILDGALKGAAYGGIAGGAGKAIGMALSGATAPAATAAPKTIGNAIGEATKAGGLETTAGGLGTKLPSMAETFTPAVTQPTVGPTISAAAQQTATNPGALTRIVDFIEKKPETASIVGQTLGGTATGLLSSMNQEDDLENAMKIAKLNREPRITDLGQLNLNPEVPTVRGYKSLPRYMVDPETGRIVRAANG